MKIKHIVSTETEKWQIKEVMPINSEGQPLFVTDEKDQTISGFGGCFNELGWEALELLSEADRNQVIEDLFSEEGCHFTNCRIPIGASDYALKWYSHNEVDGDYAMEHFSIERDHQYLLPYIHAALGQQPNMRFFASPWSPPSWMKQPKSYNYGRLVMDEKTLTAYADYFVKFLEAYEQEGVKVDQIHVQNEPFADQKFPSCLWSGEQFATFIGDYLGPAFDKKGLDTRIWLGTLNGPEAMKFMPTGQIIIDHYENTIDRVMFDEKAAPYVEGIGFQWAGQHAIQRTRESYPDIKLMQTENECGDGNNTWTYAQYVFGLMRHYLRNGCESYTYWNMVLKPGGESTWGWHQNAMINIDPTTKKAVYNHEFYVMKHLTHFVKPGAVRREVKGPWSGSAMAFENPDGGLVVLANNVLDFPRDMTMIIGDTKVSLTVEAGSINTWCFEA